MYNKSQDKNGNLINPAREDGRLADVCTHLSRCTNKTVYTKATIAGVGDFGVCSNLYIPVTKGKIHSVTVSGHKGGRVEMLYGTNGSQGIIETFWFNEYQPTFTYRFDPQLAINSTQIFQVLIWNEDAAAQVVSIVFHISE